MARTVVLLWTVIALALATSVQAHHSPSAIFEMNKPIAVSGTLTRVDWVNPHIVFMIDAKGDGGKVEQWTFQTNPPSWFRSVGLSRADFAKSIGQTITIGGVRARDGSLYGYMSKITLPGGTSYELVSGSEPK